MAQRRVFVTDACAVLQDAFIAAVHTVQTAQPLRPPTILVPNNSVAVYLRHAIAWAGRGHFGLQFSTLLDFARDCAEDSLIQAGWQPLPPLAAPFVVQELLREATPSPLFTPPSRQSGFAPEFAPESTPGLARVFLETLADCQQAGISSDHLYTFIQQAQLTGPYRNKINGIATLYARYRRFLSERQLYDDNELLARAALLLEDRPDDTPASPLFVYGFEKFSPLQRRFFAAAIQHRGDSPSRDILVFFAWRDGKAYEAATPSLSWLRSLGLQYTPLTPSAEYRRSQFSGTYESGLSRVQRRLFEEELSHTEHLGEHPGEYAKESSGDVIDNSVICLTAPGRNREAREIGRTVLSLVRDHEVRFSEIGIFLHDTSSYGSVLLETLAGFDIPCFFADDLPLLQTAMGQALQLLCWMLAEDYTRPRVFEFLSISNPPYAALLHNTDLETDCDQKLGDISVYIRPDRWEEFSQQASIVSGADEWRTRLERLEKHYQREARRQATENLDDPATSQNAQNAQNPNDLHVLRAFVIFMQDFLALTEQKSCLHTWSGWARYTLQLCQTYMRPGPETADVEETLLRLAQLDLLSAQHRSRPEDKHQPASSVTLADWVRAVTNALVTKTVSTAHPGTQGVFVGDVSAARGVRFRAVIVPGLIDASVPHTARQDPLLLDAERQHLAETVGCEITQRGQQNEEDRLLFSLIAQSAIEYLVLTYPSQDQTDQASRHAHMPSWYLLRVLEALRGTPQTFSDLESWCRRVPLVPVYTGPSDSLQNTIDTFEFHLSSVERAVATGDASPLGYLPRFAPTFFHAQQANVQRWEHARLTPFDGMLESAEARTALHQRLFPAGIVVSASALETYARCPFRYFLSAVLGLVPRQDPEQILALRPQDRGLLLHDILHDFFSQLRTAGQLPVAAQADQDGQALSQRLIQTAQKHFEHFSETHLTGFALLWELEKERMHERLALLLKRERQMGAAFVPEAFEAHFGLGMSARLAEGVSHEVLESPFFPEIPVQFELDDGEMIDLRGRIDRIDLFTSAASAGSAGLGEIGEIGGQQKARIIDYKTGKPPRGQFAKGMALQLPLYLFAAQTLRPELMWESAGYVDVDGSDRNTPAEFTAETWPEALRTLRHILTIVVTGIRLGCFFPQPDTCYPCPFPEICGSQVSKQMARKRDDPHLLAFRQLRTIP